MATSLTSWLTSCATIWETTAAPITKLDLPAGEERGCELRGCELRFPRNSFWGTRVFVVRGTRVFVARGTRVFVARGTRVFVVRGTRVFVVRGTRVFVARGTRVFVVRGTRVFVVRGTRVCADCFARLGLGDLCRDRTWDCD